MVRIENQENGFIVKAKNVDLISNANERGGGLIEGIESQGMPL